MSKLMKLIGEARATFASVLCLLSLVLLAPSAQAAEKPPYAEGDIWEYVCTDNQWETERNPFALPTTMPHWLSALCRHQVYTNYQGYGVGYRTRYTFGTWFLRTNTYYCTSLPTRKNPLYENTVRINNWNRNDKLITTASDKTCLAQIERDTRTAITGTSDPNVQVGKRVSLALCQLLRPHEVEGASGTAQLPAGYTIQKSEQNGTVLSNLFFNVGGQYKSMATSNPLAGQCLDGTTFYEGPKYVYFDNYDENSQGKVTRNCSLTPKQMVKEFDKYYGAGLANCIETLNMVPNNWNGTYVLHNRDYGKTILKETFVYTNTITGGPAEKQPRERKVTHPDAWPMFDEDVYLDRADVLLLKCACYALDTVVKLSEAYQLPDGAVGKEPGPEIQQLMQWQKNFHSFGYTIQDRPYMDPALGKDHTYRVGYGERIERAFHDFFHVVPTFLKSVDDTAAMAEARTAFVRALECFLDADAFITGTSSKTGHDYGGQRDNKLLHLFEFAEPEAGEDGGEWNIAGYREVIEKAYASLMGKGTQKAVQQVALAGADGLGKKLGIRAGSTSVDFSGLGANKDGTVQLDLNPFFDGSMTPRDFVTDVDTCVTTNGPAHWLPTRYVLNPNRLKLLNICSLNYYAYKSGDTSFLSKLTPEEQEKVKAKFPTGATGWGARYRPDGAYCEVPVGTTVSFSNRVSQLVLNVSEDTVSPTLCGIYPSGTFASDIRTMTTRYPETGKTATCGFSRYVKGYDLRKEVTAEVSPYVLEEGAVYTAMPTTKLGGAFYVNSGATLTGSDVTFAGNETSKSGGAIYNKGTVALKGTVFKGNKATSGGAIYNVKGGTLSLDGVTFEGNTAGQDQGSAIQNKGTVNFDGAVTLVTTNDTVVNNGTLNWNLAGGKGGFLDGYQNVENSGSGNLQLTVEEYPALPTNVVIATGSFLNIATAKTDTFSITNVTLGGGMAAAKVNGGFIGFVGSVLGYKLMTEEDPASGTTNLVLHVEEHYSCVREEVSGTKTLEAGKAYTAVPTEKNGGVFYVGEGAALTGKDVVFKDNEAYLGGAICNEGAVTLDNATFDGNKSTSAFSGAIFNSGTVNLDGAVTLKTASDTFFNVTGTVNWNLADGKAGLLDGYDKLGNEGGTLQLTVGDYADATNEFVIARGEFSDLAGKDEFVIRNGEATTTLKVGERTGASGYLYDLAVVEDAEAVPPTTNLVLTAIKIDMSRVVVDSTLAGGYKLGDPIEDLPGFFFGLNYVTEMPDAAMLGGIETLEIAGSAAITNAVMLKSPAKLVLNEGAALSIMGDDAKLDGLGETASIDGQGAIYLDKDVSETEFKSYTDKLVLGCGVTIARASVTDGEKGTEGGFYDVNTKADVSTETNEVITANLTADGAPGGESGLALRVTDEKNLVAAGELAATVGNQTLKLVREADAAGDLVVNGKVSGFDSILVENKNEEGKMTATSTLAAKKDITILNDGHLEAKARSGANLYVKNTTSNTLVGDYAGQNVTVTNTATGVARDIVLQAYGKDKAYGRVSLVGEDGSVYSNVVIVAGKNATPGDLSANDGSGEVRWVGTNTFSGSVVVNAKANGMEGESPLLRFANADAVMAKIVIPLEISGECNIRSNEKGTANANNAITLKDGAVLGGNTRLVSTCFNYMFVLEGTVTMKDGAEISRTYASSDTGKFEVPADATLKLQGATIHVDEFALKGTLLVESGTNKIKMGGTPSADKTMVLTLKKGASLEFPGFFNQGVINLEGGECIGDIDNYGLLNWDLAVGTTTLNWAKISNEGGTFRLTVGDAASGTGYVLATNVEETVTETFTVTNSVAGGAAATVKAGGVCKAGNTFYALDVTDGALTLTALAPVKLSDVMLIDPETGKTNATAVVMAGDSAFEVGEVGVYDVPKGYPLTVVYKAADYDKDDGYMFGPGWETKSVVIGVLAGDTSMSDEPYASLKPTAVPRWTDVREIALDTRERIVVESPDEVLTVAYSTNFWGDVTGGKLVGVSVQFNDEDKYTALRDAAKENGYCEWMPTPGAFGKYTLRHVVAGGPMNFTVNSNFVYYSTRSPLTWAQPEHGALAATVAGEAIASGDRVLGYDLVGLTATAEPHYAFRGWSATTNGVALPATAFGDTNALVTTFEMPAAPAELKAAVAWQSTFDEQVVVGPGAEWEVFADDDYQGGLANDGTVVWRPGATNALGKASGLKDFSQLENGESGKMLVAVDENVTTGEYWIASNAAGALGQKFQITDGQATNENTVVGRDDFDNDPEKAPWVYLGALRYQLVLEANGELVLVVEWGAFNAICHFGLDTVVTNRFLVNEGMVLPTDWPTALEPEPLDDAWNGSATRAIAGWAVTNEYIDAAGDLVAWADEEGRIDYYETLETAVPPMTLGDREFWVRWSYVDTWDVGATNALGEATADVSATLVDWTGEMVLAGTVADAAMQDCADPAAAEWDDPLIAPWYWGHRPYVNRLTVGAAVKRIGAYAFSDCIYLREAYFEGSVPDCGANAFANCEQAVGYYPRAFEDAWTNRIVNGRWQSLAMFCIEDVPTFAEAGTYVMMDANGRAVLTVAEGVTEVTCTSNPKNYVILAPVGVKVVDATVVPMGRTEVRVVALSVGDAQITLQISGAVPGDAFAIYGAKDLTNPQWMKVADVKAKGGDEVVAVDKGEYRFFKLGDE